MAVTSKMMSTSLKLVANVGVNPESGSPIFKTKSFSNVKLDATSENLYAAAQALASLQSHTITSIRRVDTIEIMNE